MIGAIIGDIVGSRFEWDNIKTKDFIFFTDECFFTDDSVMTLAIGDALLTARGGEDLSAQAVASMQRIGRYYPDCGYGGMFAQWMWADDPVPYDSYGNGAAMRVAGVAYVATSVEEVRTLSHAVTAVTHNHPEGLKGAEATAMATYLARTGTPLAEIERTIHEHYYDMNFTLDEIRADYQFNETCQDTVPQALKAAFAATDFTDAIRGAISIGGDSDTLAAITGAVAEAAFGVPAALRTRATAYLDTRLRTLLERFESAYPGKTAE